MTNTFQRTALLTSLAAILSAIAPSVLRANDPPPGLTVHCTDHGLDYWIQTGCTCASWYDTWSKTWQPGSNCT